MDLQILHEQLQAARSHDQSGQFQAATGRYQFVATTLQKELDTRVRSGRSSGLIVGFILGLLIPIAHIILAPLGAYYGYRWGGEQAAQRFMSSPEGELYWQALDALRKRQ